MDGGDSGRGTWWGAEVKASRGVGGLGKAQPRTARSTDAETAGCRRRDSAGAAPVRARGTTSRRGAARRRPASDCVAVPSFERVKLQKIVQKCSKW
jgi:hypothetical protein